MQHEEFYMQSADHVHLFGQVWLPEIGPKAVVCLVHGLGEHSGRYRHVAEMFNQAGYALITFDLSGHGKSGGQRGHCPSFESFMDDIDLLIGEASKRFPQLPQFLYGHSLGGMLVLNYVLRRKPKFAGVITTSSGLRSAMENQKLKVAAAKVFGAIVPTLGIPSGLDPAGLTHDQSVIDAYRSDPLVHNRLTPRMGLELLKANHYAIDHATQMDCPVLLMHGEDDPITFSSGSREFSDRAGQVSTLKLWPEKYHELHNEFGKEDVFAFLLDWLEERISAVAPGQSTQGMGKFSPA